MGNMHLYIIYAHPSPESFTAHILDAFTRGTAVAGHSFVLNDLYQSGFSSIPNSDQYSREMAWHPSDDLPCAVRNEQEKVQQAGALVCIYPVWWSDCPAIMKGWFDRVWSNGFAYAYDKDSRVLFINPKKALVLCTAGHSVEHLEATGIAQSMRCIMLKDRLENVGITEAEMVIFGGTTTGGEAIRMEHEGTAFMLGKTFGIVGQGE